MNKKAQKIQIQHLHSGKRLKSYRFGGAMFTIGSARGCSARLHTPGAQGVSGYLRKTPQGYVITDLGSESTMTFNGKPFIEELITDHSVIRVGDDEFRMSPVSERRVLFNSQSSDKGNMTVIKWRGHVLYSGPTHGVEQRLSEYSGKDFEIIRTQSSKFQELGPEGLTLQEEMRRPLLGTFLTLIVFLVIFIGIPSPKKEVEEKPKNNVYTKMIYDKKLLAQKRQQLTSHGPRTAQGTGNGNGSISEGAKGPQSKATKAVASIRKAGLQNLIGRIAARASHSAQMIAMMAAMPSADAAPTRLGGAAVVTGVTGSGMAPGNGKGFTLGGIGTGGKGGGTGGYKSGAGLGTGSIGNGEVGLDDTESVIEGGLDREVIAAIIREHLGQIRYCYERQLSANPELYGKVKVHFTIDAQGVVAEQNVSESTLKNALVEECILRRIATWSFPKPKGGTRVLVSYPFLFKSVQ
ncbi:MAG: TonB family protein [Oligoflexia bacterium]|nr:TonB family protein [Oligoflexia bacterium]